MTLNNFESSIQENTIEQPALPPTTNERRGFVIHDQRIVDEFCNLACAYCEGFGEPSPFSFRPDEERRLVMPESWRLMVDESLELQQFVPSEKPRVADFFSLGSAVIKEVAENVDSKILKLSGGEITLYDNLVEYVEGVHNQYTAVQILTNAYKLTPQQIDAFSDMGNIYFQVSLDGPTRETNWARTHNEKITQKIVDNIGHILEKGMPVEINCVLTQHNTGSFEEMLKHFQGTKDVIIIPRPVRGEPKQSMNFTPEQLASFRAAVIDKYEEYSEILPPKPYLERLIKMMDTNARSDRCYVPFFVLGSDNYGKAEMCSCGADMPSLGNILSDPDEVFTKHNEFNNYAPEVDHDDCSYCMTQYEIMNLYIEDQISEEELQKVPSFRYAGILEEIQRTKQELISRGILLAQS